jgi:hypothetical protein
MTTTNFPKEFIERSEEMVKFMANEPNCKKIMSHLSKDAKIDFMCRMILATGF